MRENASVAIERICISAAVVFAAAAMPALGSAQDSTSDSTTHNTSDSTNHLYRKFELTASGTLLILGSTIRVDPDTGTGTEFDAEDALGLSRTTPQPRIALRWRLGRRHELEGGFLRAIRSSDKVLNDTIVFRDTSFAAGLRVHTSLGTSQAFLTYRYAFTAKEKTQIGVGLGLGMIFLRNEIDALAGATPGGADTTIREFSGEANLNGPTGSLGLYGRFQLADRWYLESDLRGVYVKVSNVQAGIIELGAAGRYFLSNTFGVELGYGLGFYAVRLDHEASGSNGFAGIDLAGKIRYTVQGIRLGLVVAF